MDPEKQHCPECGAAWADGNACTEAFHQMLFWEAEDPALGVVHHLTVLCYHLQHPSLYSPETLNGAKQLLIDFVERGVSPQTVRQRDRTKLDSGNRSWKIKGTAGSHGAYSNPIRWSMTAPDVTARGMEHYQENVRAWAQSILTSMRDSHNS
jgi:hypothetical protein